MMKNIKKVRFGKICRGLALIILGVLVIRMPTGCGALRKNTPIPDEGEKVVYSDTGYKMVQGEAIHKASPEKGREYVFIPLTMHNGSGMGIIFSSRICIAAYALPSGESCPYSADAVMYGKEHIDDFRLFDGVIYSGYETLGWLAFDLPQGTKSVHIDFSTGINEGECLSFDCKI